MRRRPCKEECSTGFAGPGLDPWNWVCGPVAVVLCCVCCVAARARVLTSRFASLRLSRRASRTHSSATGRPRAIENVVARIVQKNELGKGYEGRESGTQACMRAGAYSF